MSIPFFPALLILSALWGASFLFMRVAAPEFGPVALIALRVLIAGTVLLPIVVRRREWAALKRHAGLLLLAGALNAALPFTLLAYATLHLSAGLTSILNATVPLFGAVIGVWLFRERMETQRILGVVLGFAGVFVLVGVPQSDSGTPLLPVIACLLAAISYVFAANLAKRRLADVSAMVFVTGSQLSAAALTIPLVAVFPPSQMPGEVAWASVVGLAVFSTSLAFLIYFHLIHSAGPTRTLTVTYLIPLFAVGWGALLLDEPLTLNMLFGGGLVLLGVWLANRTVRVRRTARRAIR